MWVRTDMHQAGCSGRIFSSSCPVPKGGLGDSLVHFDAFAPQLRSARPATDAYSGSKQGDDRSPLGWIVAGRFRRRFTTRPAPELGVKGRPGRAEVCMPITPERV